MASSAQKLVPENSPGSVLSGKKSNLSKSAYLPVGKIPTLSLGASPSKKPTSVIAAQSASKKPTSKALQVEDAQKSERDVLGSSVLRPSIHETDKTLAVPIGSKLVPKGAAVTSVVKKMSAPALTKRSEDERDKNIFIINKILAAKSKDEIAGMGFFVADEFGWKPPAVRPEEKARLEKRHKIETIILIICLVIVLVIFCIVAHAVFTAPPPEPRPRLRLLTDIERRRLREL